MLLLFPDRKSLLALQDVGPESEAESVGFQERRVARAGPDVKAAARKRLRLRIEGPLNKGCCLGLLLLGGSCSMLNLLRAFGVRELGPKPVISLDWF
jgi:hypothetical protein